MVAYYASQQTVVGGGDPVVVVDGKGGQRRHIHTVFHLLLYVCGKLRIQSVDALNEQYGIVVETHLVTFVDAASKLEIVCRQRHFLPPEQRVEVGVELCQIQRVKRLEIVVPGLVAGGDVAVHEIVVKRYDSGRKEIGHQIYAEALGSGGLA